MKVLYICTRIFKRDLFINESGLDKATEWMP